MSETLIGLLFILAGVIYGSLALDDFYGWTLGWLVKHDWIKPPKARSQNSLFGRKPTILFYSAILIIIGLFILWNRNN
ncbi:MAG TPA: hypothetical protein VHA30_01090 [Patescibacteria group bacterium]|nr:hypothetical protein [Patescibacteria group bacterium]